MQAIIEDLTLDFCAFWEQARNCDIQEQRRLWDEAYAGLHSDIFDFYFRDYAHLEHIVPALRRYPPMASHIAETATLVRARIQEDFPQLITLLGLEDLEASLRHVVLVGVFDSNAWEASLHGQPTCFFAVERISNLLAASVLVAHEATHGLHALANPGVAGEESVVGKSLFLEGFAVFVSALAAPGFTETDYLWMGEPQTPQGAAVQDWLKACEVAWPTLRTQLLRDLAAQDDPTHGAYFTYRAAYLRDGIPARAGYFVGHRLMAALANKYSVAEIVRWPLDHALELLRNALEDAESCPPASMTELPN